MVGAALLLPAAARGRTADRPRLVVVVIVDQFPANFLDRFAPLFGKGGFERLLAGGAVFRDFRHGHAATFTAPGHATLLTGAHPARHGIVSNAWYPAKSRHLQKATADIREEVVGGAAVPGEPGVSPRHLLVPALGDSLRADSGLRSMVVALSLKARAAVLSGGWRPSSVYWFDPATCRFVTSTYYRQRLEPWVEEFNRQRHCDRYLGGRWQLLLPPARYAEVADVDDAPEETNVFGLGTRFPHPVSVWEDLLAPLDRRGLGRHLAIAASPFGNEILMGLARLAVSALGLGSDETPDLLVVSFSSNDLVGHAFGPDSVETADTVARLDRLLSGFLSFLDREVGSGRWTLALTSDHGVAPIPERMRRLGLLPERKGGYRFDPRADRRKVEDALRSRFFGSSGAPAGFPGFIRVWDEKSEPFVRLDRAAARWLPGGRTRSDIRREAAREIRKLKSVAAVFRAGKGAGPAAGADCLGRAVYRSWHPARGGDLFVLRRPYLLPQTARSTTHGTPYGYDARVPLLLYGRGIERGMFARPAEAVDLAPTLAELLRVSPPAGSEGRILAEALAGVR